MDGIGQSPAKNVFVYSYQRLACDLVCAFWKQPSLLRCIRNLSWYVWLMSSYDWCSLLLLRTLIDYSPGHEFSWLLTVSTTPTGYADIESTLAGYIGLTRIIKTRLFAA